MLFWKKKVRTFKELRKLERLDVFIVGNGPSLVKHNLDSLTGIPTFASNAVYLIFGRTNWRPDYYTCVDTAVLPDRSSEIVKWARKLKSTNFVFPDTIFTHEKPHVPTLVSSIVPSRKNVSFFESVSLELRDSPESAFQLNGTDNLITEATTVTISLMQMAAKLGARRIFLIGCDTSYTIPQEARILDQDTPRVDKRIILDSDSDPNHFDPRYFGAGKVWHTPNTKLMIEHYSVAKSICDKNGIEVFNAGIGGSLEVFPRVSFDWAVKECLGFND